ncbi:MAG: aspartate carbamoyltransferase catalytic subunit [Deltaproteobacteria bacterium]|nr:aspartate carbamoyltransferase catalytic subunit [Deltaproteobacteria bacterium]
MSRLTAPNAWCCAPNKNCPKTSYWSPTVPSPPASRLSCRHLLGIEDLNVSDVVLLLQNAKAFASIHERSRKKVPTLSGTTLVNCFFENSTRTRMSFELAAKRLSADTINFSGSTSSLKKGETFLDTARTIESYRPDLLVLRHQSAGACHLLTQVTAGAVINAGDGEREHPTQALLDAYTLLEHFGRLDDDDPFSFSLKGKSVAIIGDIEHSRVARSNFFCLRLLGAEVRVAGPATMIPQGLDQYGVQVCTSVDEALEDVSAVMMLRIQKERLQGPLLPSDDEYHRFFGLTKERAARLPNVPFLHPGPINRGVEIDPEAADSKQALIFRQSQHGIPVRMAVLHLLALGLRAEAP